MIITKNTKAADIILQNHNLIPVFSRFGIKFGFGDKNIEQICNAYNINVNFFLEIVNAFNDKDYLPYRKLREMPLNQTVNYLLKSHYYYNKVKLPLIESLIERLEWKRPENSKNKSVLKKFFSNYRKEVTEHTLNEEKNIYPYILELESVYSGKKQNKNFQDKIKEKSINDYADTHEELNSTLLDLKNILIKYLTPPVNNEITEQILNEIFWLEKDMNDHTELEDNVIIPVAVKMENELKKSL